MRKFIVFYWFVLDNIIYVRKEMKCVVKYIVEGEGVLVVLGV